MINFVKGLILLAGKGKISVEEVGHNTFIVRTFSGNDCYYLEKHVLGGVNVVVAEVEPVHVVVVLFQDEHLWPMLLNFLRP